jgi:hypothetical protein
MNPLWLILIIPCTVVASFGFFALLSAVKDDVCPHCGKRIS